MEKEKLTLIETKEAQPQQSNEKKDNTDSPKESTEKTPSEPRLFTLFEDSCYFYV